MNNDPTVWKLFKASNSSNDSFIYSWSLRYRNQIDEIASSNELSLPQKVNAIRDFLVSKIDEIKEGKSEIELEFINYYIKNCRLDIIAAIIQHDTKISKLLCENKDLHLRPGPPVFMYGENVWTTDSDGLDVPFCDQSKLGSIIDSSVGERNITYLGKGFYRILSGKNYYEIKTRYESFPDMQYGNSFMNNIKTFKSGYFVKTKDPNNYYNLKHDFVYHNLNGPSNISLLESKYEFAFSIDGMLLDKKDSAKCLKYFLNGEMKTLNELMSILQFKYQMAEKNHLHREGRSSGHKICYGVY